MNEIEREIKKRKIKVEFMNKKINYITKFLNENDIDYEVKVWESGEGKEIIIGNVVIEFSVGGYVGFKTKQELENE